MIFGLDLLGIGSRHWNINETIRVWPSGFALGAFDGEWPHSFGNPIPNIRRILDTGKCPILRVHIWWDKNHSLPGKHICPENILKKRCKAYEALKTQYPSVTVYISHSCEYSGVSQSDVSRRVGIVYDYAPSCIPINTPMRAASGGAMVERHGAGPVVTGSIISHDGLDAAQIDIEAWKEKNKRALIQFFWAPLFNLRENGPLIEPDKRTKAPDARYIKDVIEWTQPAGTPPPKSFPGTVRPIKRPLLWKIMSEDSQEDPMSKPEDPRENKPLLIASNKANTATVITFEGQQVCTLGYFGPYNSEYRYYSGYRGGTKLSGSEIAEEARQISGSPWVWLKVKDKIYGPVHANRRAGYFQK